MSQNQTILSFDFLPGPAEKKGSALVICHGLLGSKKNWSSFAQKLSRYYPVYTVDMRNHGDSFHGTVSHYSDLSEDLIAFLDFTQLSSAIFLGHSAGGKLVMNLSLLYPEKLQGLIVLDSSPLTSFKNLPVMEALNLLKPLSVNTYEEAVTSFKEVGIDEKIGRWLCGNLTRDENKKLVWKINLPELLRVTPLLLAEPMPPGKTYTKPTLFINSQKTGLLPLGQREEVLKIFPKAEFQIFEEAGHNIHMDEPERLLRSVVAFVEQN